MSNKLLKMQVLAPVKLSESQQEELHFDTYKQALDSVFVERKGDEAEILNIALSGSYGAGKSSIMKTYEALTPEKKIIHVSFAHFEATKPKEKEHLQTKIVNQLIHQIEKEYILDSNLKLKTPVKDDVINKYTVMGSMFVIAFLYLTLFCDVIWKIYMFDGQKYLKIGCNLVAIGAICVSTVYFIKRIMERQLRKPLIRSLSIDKSVIDFADNTNEKEKEDSIFDRYMDEIIYLIMNAHIDAIAFEDMDRFENIEIFNDLRELNFLVNNKKREADEDNRKIRFIYLIKDDLFEKATDRTKFFDLIIPVVPVMNAGNSFELLAEVFRDQGLDLNELEKSYNKYWKVSYLKKLCIYIPDYRMLKNICNEFFVYCRQLEADKSIFNYTKLFAIITYKNLFPEDYNQFQYREGYVYELFESFNNYIEDECQEIEEERKEEIKQLEWLEIEATDEDEEKLLLVDEKRTRTLYLKEKYECLREMSVLDLKEKQGISLDSIWRKRKGYMLSEDQLDDESEKFRVARMLVEDGMLVEKEIEYYTSYFYQGNLTREDMNFLNRVYLGNGLSREEQLLKLEHPEKILERLERIDYFSKGIRNDCFVDFLLENGEDEKIQWIIRGLRRDQDWRCAVELIDSVGLKWKYMHLLLNEWSDIWEKVASASELSSSKKIELLVDFFAGDGVWDHLTERAQESMLAFLQENEGIFRNLPYAKIKDVLPILREKDYKFSYIVSDCCEETIGYIYENNMYQINPQNIEYIFYFRLNKGELELREHNFECIESATDKRFQQYIEEYFFEYAAVYRENYLKDSMEPHIVWRFINNEKISDEWKEAFIKEMPESLKIEVLDNIDEYEWQKKLVDADKVVFNATNILSYWEREEMVDETLKTYLKLHYQKETCDLSFYSMEKYFEKNEQKSSLIHKLIVELLSMPLMKKGYENLVESLMVTMGAFPFETIPEGEIEFLIENGIINMSQSNLRKMREQYKEYIVSWVAELQDEYVHLLKQKRNMIIEEELHSIIAQNEIRIEEKTKLSLIALCEKKIPIYSFYRSSEIEAIIEKGLFNEEFRGVFDKYNSKRCKQSTKEKVYELVIKEIEALLSNYTIVPYSMLAEMLKDSRLNLMQKKSILAEQIDLVNYNMPVLKQFFEIINDEGMLQLMEGKETVIEGSNVNKKLLDSMYAKNYVEGYWSEEDKYRVAPGLQIELYLGR